MSSLTTNKKAFYPCCAHDVLGPLKIMKGLVDEVIFCDISRSNTLNQREKQKIALEVNEGDLPNPIYLRKNVEKAVLDLDVIHIFFYRYDSQSEGGSGLYLLGKEWLKKILKLFPEKGGLIISDGSNSDEIWGEIIKSEGFTWQEIGWKFNKFEPNIEIRNQIEKSADHLSFIQVERV